MWLSEALMRSWPSLVMSNPFWWSQQKLAWTPTTQNPTSSYNNYYTPNGVHCKRMCYTILDEQGNAHTYEEKWKVPMSIASHTPSLFYSHRNIMFRSRAKGMLQYYNTNCRLLIKCFWYRERWFARPQDTYHCVPTKKTKSSSNRPHVTPLECAKKNQKSDFCSCVLHARKRLWQNKNQKWEATLLLACV